MESNSDRSEENQKKGNRSRSFVIQKRILPSKRKGKGYLDIDVEIEQALRFRSQVDEVRKLEEMIMESNSDGLKKK